MQTQAYLAQSSILFCSAISKLYKEAEKLLHLIRLGSLPGWAEECPNHGAEFLVGKVVVEKGS